jgi:HEAT repeat protein
MPTIPAMTVGKAISMLRSAIVNARIYPKGSQMVDSTIKGAQQALETCLQETSPIVISDIQGKLCVNGKEVAEAKDFRPFLVQHEVQSVKFLKGLEPREVASLIDALGKKKSQLGTAKNLEGWLKSEGVAHIQAEEVEFVELKKGEVVVQQVLSLLEQSTDVSSLASALEESYRLIDQLPDEAQKKEAQKKMAAHLSSLPPNQLRELFDAKLADNVEKSDLKEAVVQSMSHEKLEETLEEVNKWYHQIKEDSKSEFEVVEKLAGLKSFLGKVLHSPASKTVPFALYEELLNVGLLDEIPAGVQKGENAGLLTEVEGLLSQPDEALLEPTVRQRLPDVLKALCAMGLDEPLGKLTEKMLHNLQNPAPVARETAMKMVCVFEETLAANRKDKPFMQIVSFVHHMSESESSPDVYGHIVEALQVAAMELLVHWRFDECAQLLATLRRHSREESPIGHKKKQLAAKALHEFSVRGLEVVCADFNASLKDRQNGAQRVLAELGEEAVGPLVEVVKRSVDLRAKQAAVQALKRLGPSVKDALAKEMNVGTSGDALVKLIPLLEDFADQTILPVLSGLLHHPEGTVRRQVAQLLAKVKDPKIQGLLMNLLDDTDPDVQSEALRLIGELKMNTAAMDIARRLPKAGAALQEQMCVTLGTLGDKNAVPHLINLLGEKKSFWKRSSGVPDAIRVRAIWALGQLLPEVSAREALTKALKDPNAMVQRAAQNALNKVSAPAYEFNVNPDFLK